MQSGAFSKVRLGRLRDGLAGYVDRGEVAGLVALVARRDEVHVEAIGRLDLETGAPVRRNAVFRIASMTKPIAAAAAMTLVEEARLRLDDPVDRWLPELADRRVLRAIDGPLGDTVPAERPITLRDLLTFRAGIGALMQPPGTYPIQRAMAEAGIAPGPLPPALPPDEMLARYGRLPLMHQPGERWLYHNGFDILGVLIARVAGQPLEQVLAERIFVPLGMQDTAFHLPEGKRDRLAGCYRAEAGSGRLVADDPGSAPVFPSAGTGLCATADDILAFGRMMLRCGRHGTERLLARLTVEAMTADQITPEQKARSPFFPGFWDRYGWGFGVAIVTRCDGIAAVPGRYGWFGGLGTSWWTDPREEMVGVLLAQRLFDPVTAALHADFETLAYQAIDD